MTVEEMEVFLDDALREADKRLSAANAECTRLECEWKEADRRRSKAQHARDAAQTARSELDRVTFQIEFMSREESQ